MFFFSPSVEKMKMIDKEYENFNYSGDRYFSFQSKLAEYRKEIEAQVQAEMDTKVHFVFFRKVNESKTVPVSAIINILKGMNALSYMTYLLVIGLNIVTFFSPQDGTF